MNRTGLIAPRPGGNGIRFRAVDRARRAIHSALAVPAQELARMFTVFDAERIEQEAFRVDADEARRGGALTGLTVSIKDLFDEVGIVTAAGSTVLRTGTAASSDAVAVARLRAAGAVPCGRTTMSEFAYSGVGLNPHYGNLGNARDARRISGGSTSGGALSVAKGIAEVALGTDTGGSIRIPAALNGLAGFKPTQASVPLTGAFPLSGTYDSVGPLARDIVTCAAVFAVLSETAPQGAAPKNLRLGVATGPLLDGLDDQVATDFERALRHLADSGVEIVETDAVRLDEFGRANRVIVAREAHAIHRDRLDALETQGDPRVLRRIRAAEDILDPEEMEIRRMRQAAIESFAQAGAEFDAFLAPTVPTVAPFIADVEAEFDALNALMLRNPSAVNFLDGCAATVPMQGDQDLTTGLMIFAPGGSDWKVLDLAARAEAVLAA